MSTDDLSWLDASLSPDERVVRLIVGVTPRRTTALAVTVAGERYGIYHHLAESETAAILDLDEADMETAVSRLRDAMQLSGFEVAEYADGDVPEGLRRIQATEADQFSDPK